MTADVRINNAEFSQAEALLAKLDAEMRSKAVPKSLERAADIIVAAAQREVPQPGYPGDDPKKKPLRDTIAKEVKTYPSGTVVAVVGPQYPAGAHGHLVHEGHEIWLPVPGYTKGADTVNTGRRSRPDPFLERAADGTTAAQGMAIVSTLRQAAANV